MKQHIFNSLQQRRSQYNLSNQSSLSDDELQELIEQSLLQTPTAFNSQTGRVVLLLGMKHHQLWDLVLSTLKPLVPSKSFPKTEEKIKSFRNAYGTILFFEEEAIIKTLQEKFPLYRDSFPLWSIQSAGMLNLIVWTAISEAKMGASLQHYNPLIDDEVKRMFNLPSSWRLIAQMPFGVALSLPDKKESVPVKNRYQIIK
ncbi:MAG: nitroreductase family protein [Bacilli bacterium]